MRAIPKDFPPPSHWTVWLALAAMNMRDYCEATGGRR